MRTHRHTQPVIEIENPSAAIPVTREQLHAIGLTDSDIEAGEKRFIIAQSGPWHGATSITGPVEEADYSEGNYGITVCKVKRFYSPRAMRDLKPCGYDMEGRISLGGKKHHAFTTSQLFELPCGKLVNVATLHLCTR